MCLRSIFQYNACINVDKKCLDIFFSKKNGAIKKVFLKGIDFLKLPCSQYQVR